MTVALQFIHNHIQQVLANFKIRLEKRRDILAVIGINQLPRSKLTRYDRQLAGSAVVEPSTIFTEWPFPEK